LGHPAGQVRARSRAASHPGRRNVGFADRSVTDWIRRSRRRFVLPFARPPGSLARPPRRGALARRAPRGFAGSGRARDGVPLPADRPAPIPTGLAEPMRFFLSGTDNGERLCPLRSPSCPLLVRGPPASSGWWNGSPQDPSALPTGKLWSGWRRCPAAFLERSPVFAPEEVLSGRAVTRKAAEDCAFRVTRGSRAGALGSCFCAGTQA